MNQFFRNFALIERSEDLNYLHLLQPHCISFLCMIDSPTLNISGIQNSLAYEDLNFLFKSI